MVYRHHLALLAALLAAAPACSGFEYEGWLNQPIPIRLHDNVPLIEISFAKGQRLLAAIDSGSPLTVVKQDGSGRRRFGELRLQDGAAPDVTRFVFYDQEVFDFSLGELGLNDPVEVGGLLGTALLSRFSVTLRYDKAAPALVLRDNVPDSDQELAADCAPKNLLDGIPQPDACPAVISAQRSGGGSAEIGDEVIAIPPTRLILPVCLMANDFDPTTATPQTIVTTGQPATALIDTGLSTSVISRSAFERLRGHFSVSETPGATLKLPYGVEQVSLTTISGVALVADLTRDQAACGELARRRRLLLARRGGVLEGDAGRSGASVAEQLGAISFAIVEDSSPLLSGLRSELRPIYADVDILLGGSFFSAFSLNLDYPSDRVILRCNASASTCRILPFCARAGDDGPQCQ